MVMTFLSCFLACNSGFDREMIIGDEENLELKSEVNKLSNSDEEPWLPTEPEVPSEPIEKAIDVNVYCTYQGTYSANETEEKEDEEIPSNPQHNWVVYCARVPLESKNVLPDSDTEIIWGETAEGDIALNIDGIQVTGLKGFEISYDNNNSLTHVNVKIIIDPNTWNFPQGALIYRYNFIDTNIRNHDEAHIGHEYILVPHHYYVNIHL